MKRCRIKFLDFTNWFFICNPLKSVITDLLSVFHLMCIEMNTTNPLESVITYWSFIFGTIHNTQRNQCTTNSLKFMMWLLKNCLTRETVSRRSRQVIYRWKRIKITCVVCRTNPSVIYSVQYYGSTATGWFLDIILAMIVQIISGNHPVVVDL